jgi:hypothetical protein
MENLNNTDKTSENTEKELSISDVIPRFSNLSEDDRKGIHEVLFQMDILELEDDDKVEEYYNQLPNDIKKDGVRWGFQDSVVRDTMCVWFEKNVV